MRRLIRPALLLVARLGLFLSVMAWLAAQRWDVSHDTPYFRLDMTFQGWTIDPTYNPWSDWNLDIGESSDDGRPVFWFEDMMNGRSFDVDLPGLKIDWPVFGVAHYLIVTVFVIACAILHWKHLSNRTRFLLFAPWAVVLCILIRSDLHWHAVNSIEQQLRYRGVDFFVDSDNQNSGIQWSPGTDDSNCIFDDATLRKVSKLPYLERIELDDPQISADGIAALRGAENLASLEVRYFVPSRRAPSAWVIGDREIEAIGRLKSLKNLCLQNADVSDAGLIHLRGLTELEHLDLSGTRVTDRGLVHLHTLLNLSGIDLRRCSFGDGVTQAGIDDLQKYLPACEIEH